MTRKMLLIVTILAALSIGKVEPSSHIVHFHPNVPSNLFVNAAHGPISIKKAAEDGETEIINLLLYPTDKKSRAPKTARVVFSSGSVQGVLTLRQDNPPAGPTFIAGTLEGLSPGGHAINIYTLGDLAQGCSSVGSIYGPHKISASRKTRHRHTGYLGTIMADDKGKAEVAITDPYVSLVGPRSILGRAIGITDNDNAIEDVDTVDETPRDGCGVIGYAK